MTPAQFRSLVLNYHTKQGRHALPWRETTDPYKILVSEVMLQQTQVERVIPYYRDWMKKYPTVKKLASASLADVLKSWQGLGYNRRGKALWEAAKKVVELGEFPTSAEELEKLPGVGPYTARAVMAFAYNTDVIFIETNIRTAVTHHFFPKKKKVDDKELLAILEKAYSKGKARVWYAALMDYGSFLKRSGVKLNARAKGYTKQSTFAGSSRQARGAILKALVDGPLPLMRLVLLLGDDRKIQVATQVNRLYNEGMIERKGKNYILPT